MVLADFLIKSVSAPTAVVGSEGANQRHFIYAVAFKFFKHNIKCCLLYTSDAADE